MIRKFFRSLGHALRGLKYVWREEHTFRIQSACALCVVVAMIAFRFTYIEITFLLLAIMMVLAGEVFNTLLEDILNIIEPRHHAIVGRLKDMMAGVVLVLSCGALAVGIVVALHHFL